MGIADRPAPFLVLTVVYGSRRRNDRKGHGGHSGRAVAPGDHAEPTWALAEDLVTKQTRRVQWPSVPT